MKRTICSAIIAMFLAVGAAQAAEPAMSGHEHGTAKPDETSAAKPDPQKEMPHQMGMHGKHEGMGKGMDCGMMGGKSGGMDCPMMGGKGGGMGDCMKGGCGGSHDTLTAVAHQEVLQILRDMLKVQEQLADGLKGKDKTRAMKDLDQIGKRLDQLQTDFRSSLMKDKGCAMPCCHGGMEGHGEKGDHEHAGH